MSFSWQNLALQKPILGLSPMDGITDFPFRQIHANKGKPDVMFTEFTHVEGMWHGRPLVLENFLYHHTQRPIIAQIYGNKPDYFYKATLMVCAMGFDGVDINMGCPAKNVTHSGGGAALINTPEIAVNIIKTVQKATHDWYNGITLEAIGVPQEKIDIINKIYLYSQEQEVKPYISFTPNPTHHSAHLSPDRLLLPVSIKTRTGIDKPKTYEWISTLLSTQPANISLHGRTLKQMYTDLADWEELAKAAQLVRATNTTFLANGDIESHQDALNKIELTQSHGALVGRATLGNPWFWQQDKAVYDKKDRLADALQHSIIHSQTKEEKLFIQMRKHFGFYIKDFPNAIEIRKNLITKSSINETKEIIELALQN